MLTDLKSRGPTPHHTSASAGGILNHGGTLILNASNVDDNTAAEGRRRHGHQHPSSSTSAR